MNDRDDWDDDEPNEPELAWWVKWLVGLLCLTAIGLCATYIFAVATAPKAKAQGYLPPERYTQPEPRARRPVETRRPQAGEALEYYAEDWVVLDQREKLVCRDPYIMRDLHVIRCVGNDPVR